MKAARRWLLAWALVITAGCGVRPQDHPQPIGGSDPSTPSATSTGPSAPALSDGDVYLIRDNRLTAVERTAHTLKDQMAALLDGPVPSERNAGLRSALPAGVGPVIARHEGVVTVIEIPGGFFDVDGVEQVLAVAQLAYTFTDNSGRHTAVRLRRNGNDLPAPTSSGELVTRPVTRADYAPFAPR